MAKCTFCTGTHYLSDSPDLGPCVCCTPDAMQARDRTIEALTAPKSMAVMLDELEGIVSDIRNDFAEMERERDEAQGETADIVSALQAYLASLEYGAAPVTLPPGPLHDLCVAVGVL